MAWCPFAARHEIPPGPNDPPITPRIVVLHTMVGTMAGSEAHFRDGQGIEAHFGAATDGRLWQWRDTGVQADAQAGGNDYCISVETEDMGDPSRPWAPAQLATLARLLAWAGGAHQIPMRLVAATGERGIGYHRQFPEWNPNNHSCPGDVRQAQLTGELLPSLQGGDLSMADAQAVLDALKQLRQDLVVDGTLGLADSVEKGAARERLALQKLDALAAAVAAGFTDAQLDRIAAQVATRLEIAGGQTLTITGEATPKAPPV